MRRSCLALSLSLACPVAALAQATPAPATPPAAPAESPAAARAKALYDQGVARFQAKDFRGAAQAFQQAYNLESSPALLFNLGRAHEEMGDPAGAVGHFETYLARFPAAEDHIEVSRRLAALKAVARGMSPGYVTVTGLPGDAVVFIDDQRAEAPDAEGRWSVSRGTHMLRIEREGYEPLRLRLEVEPSKATAATYRETPKVKAAPAPVPTPAPVVVQASDGSGLAVGGWIAAGLGAVALGVAGVFVVNGNTAEDDYYDLADRIDGQPEGTVSRDLDRLRDLRDDFNSARTTSRALFITGGVLLATGVGLLTWDLLSDDTAGGARGELKVGAGPTGLVFSGSF